MEGRSEISEHLKIVEVKCNVDNKIILELLKFLFGFDIRKQTNETFHAPCIMKIAFICEEGTKKANGGEETLEFVCIIWC